jgi:predicted  nucleic acid-binding Zn-ribbon protein
MAQQEVTAMNNRISTLEAEKEALSSENKKFQQQVAYLQKHLFGRKSEKTSVVFDGQIDLFDKAEQEAKKNLRTGSSNH